MVHRLDRETSGIVVFAKDAQTHRELCLLWEKREVEKLYRALVEGSVAQTEGMIEFPLKPFGSGRMGIGPQGKPSAGPGTGFSKIFRFNARGSGTLDCAKAPRSGFIFTIWDTR